MMALLSPASSSSIGVIGVVLTKHGSRFRHSQAHIPQPREDSADVVYLLYVCVRRGIADEEDMIYMMLYPLSTRYSR